MEKSKSLPALWFLLIFRKIMKRVRILIFCTVFPHFCGLGIEKICENCGKSKSLPASWFSLIFRTIMKRVRILFFKEFSRFFRIFCGWASRKSAKIVENQNHYPFHDFYSQKIIILSFNDVFRWAQLTWDCCRARICQGMGRPGAERYVAEFAATDSATDSAKRIFVPPTSSVKMGHWSIFQ